MNAWLLPRYESSGTETSPAAAVAVSRRTTRPPGSSDGRPSSSGSWIQASPASMPSTTLSSRISAGVPAPASSPAARARRTPAIATKAAADATRKCLVAPAHPHHLQGDQECRQPDPQVIQEGGNAGGYQRPDHRLLLDERQEGQRAGLLDGHRQPPLVLRAGARDAPRQDLAPLGDEAPQGVRVAVMQAQLLAAELADLAAEEAPEARPAAVLEAVAAAEAPAAFAAIVVPPLARSPGPALFRRPRPVGAGAAGREGVPGAGVRRRRGGRCRRRRRRRGAGRAAARGAAAGLAAGGRCSPAGGGVAAAAAGFSRLLCSLSDILFSDSS